MSPEPATLSEYLRALRGELSQKAAAAKVGTSRRQWIRWESEGKGIDEENADKIAKGFRRPKKEVRRYVRVRPRPEEILATLQRLEQRITRLERLVRSQDAPTAPREPEGAHESP